MIATQSYATSIGQAQVRIWCKKTNKLTLHYSVLVSGIMGIREIKYNWFRKWLVVKINGLWEIASERATFSCVWLMNWE